MELSVAIRLIQGGVKRDVQQNWADLGCGKGLFSKALATLLPEKSNVFAVDRDKKSLEAIENKVGTVLIRKVEADFIYADLYLESLDGILMANAFHFVQSKEGFVNAIKSILKTSGR